MNIPAKRPTLPQKPTATMPGRPMAPPARPAAPPARPAAPPPAKPAQAAAPARPVSPPPTRPAAPPPARPSAPPPVAAKPAAPAAPSKPASPPPPPARPSAPPAVAAPSTAQAPPPRKGGAPSQPASPPPAKPSTSPASPVAIAKMNAETSTREENVKNQVRGWVIDLIMNDADVQAAIQGLFGEGEVETQEPGLYDGLDLYSENGDIDAQKLFEASGSMSKPQVDGVPELLSENGFAYPPEATGLLARRKYIATWISEVQAAQDAEAQGEESEEEEAPEGLDDDRWCEDQGTGNWYYAHDYTDLQPGDTVCYTRDLAGEGEEPGCRGYYFLVGTISEDPVRQDKDRDTFLALTVTADRDNREVLAPLYPEGQAPKIGDEVELQWYPKMANEQIFQYIGRLEQTSGT